MFRAPYLAYVEKADTYFSTLWSNMCMKYCSMCMYMNIYDMPGMHKPTCIVISYSYDTVCGR